MCHYKVYPGQYKPWIPMTHLPSQTVMSSCWWQCTIHKCTASWISSRTVQCPVPRSNNHRNFFFPPVCLLKAKEPRPEVRMIRKTAVAQQEWPHSNFVQSDGSRWTATPVVSIINSVQTFWLQSMHAANCRSHSPQPRRAGWRVEGAGAARGGWHGSSALWLPSRNPVGPVSRLVMFIPAIFVVA